VSPDAHTPAQRADAVLRAAEVASVAPHAPAAAAHAASLPEPAPPPVVAPSEPAAPAEPVSAPEPPIHEAGAAGRLLAAAGDLEAHVAQARAQLDALEDALARLQRYDPPAD
jgi:hypothetical protein